MHDDPLLSIVYTYGMYVTGEERASEQSMSTSEGAAARIGRSKPDWTSLAARRPVLKDREDDGKVEREIHGGVAHRR